MHDICSSDARNFGCGRCKNTRQSALVKVSKDASHGERGACGRTVVIRWGDLHNVCAAGGVDVSGVQVTADELPERLRPRRKSG